jgi:hypothetical protein
MTNSSDSDSSKKTPVGLVLLAWLFVGIPLIWGVSQTIMKSMDLFRPPRQTAAAPTTAPAMNMTPPAPPATAP